MRRRICIIGLDCLSPELVFGELGPELPHLAALAGEGLSGRLESSIPPITVPAWASLFTGLDPGSLGCYGFRDRADRSYTARRLASSLSFAAPPLWSYVGRVGGLSRLITLPQTYPPKTLAGFLVSDAPAASSGPRTYPPELEAEVLALAGGDLTDVTDHRRQSLEALRDAVHGATRRRFRLARAWVQERDWTLLALVDMGPDRMHHAFWRYRALDHPAHVPGHPWARAIADYYRALDAEVGALVELCAPEDIVLVVSDHGAQSLKGGIAVNQWLLEHGYLVLSPIPTCPTAVEHCAVDWRRTRAWADGGHVARVYLNVAGREPEGCVAPVDLEPLAQTLAAELEDLPGPHGERLASRAFRPREVYRQTRGVPPELIVYFDDLAYRAVGSVGHPGVYLRGNDTGRDDANHARHGLVILRDGRGARPAPSDASLYDVAPTLLERLGLAIPAQMRGRVLA
jgi:predicted AlkP superfamily phosphohydrolase/phosphomutase